MACLTKVFLLLLGCGLIGLVGYKSYISDMQSLYFDYMCVCILGGLFGLAEILSRYHDEPWRAINSTPARYYLLVNGCASIAGLALLHMYGWQSQPQTSSARSGPTTVTRQTDDAAGPVSGNKIKPQTEEGQAANEAVVTTQTGSTSIQFKAPATRCTHILLAGFGAMALFRSSLFNFRVGGQDVGVGPNIVLQSILASIDASVDRLRGGSRNRLVTETMANVSFDKAYQILPAHCLGLLQNASVEAQTSLSNEVQAIYQGNSTDEAKSLLLGLALTNLVGEELLKDVVSSLGQSIVRVNGPQGDDQ